MRRLISLVLLSIVPLTAGCILFFVQHPSSTTAGSTIDIDIVLLSKSSASGAETPVACIAYPASWGTVQSATYEALVSGVDSISGSGVMATPEAAVMNSSYAYTTGGELASWQCYAGANTNYSNDSSGTATFRVAVGSSGIYTLQYSAGSVSQGPDESIASKSLAVGASLDSLDRWFSSSVEFDNDGGIITVAYGEGSFAAAGVLQENSALTSGNGRDWTSTTVSLAGDLRSMVYGDSQFLLIDDTGTAAISPDGSSWIQSYEIGFQTMAATYGTGVFVAVGFGGLAAVSSDGAVWSTNQASTVSTDVFYSVTYGGGKFSAVGFNGTNAISYASTNGVDWIGTPIGAISETLYGIAYGNSRYVAVGSGGLIMWSTNGYGSWNLVTSGTNEILVGITWDGSTFVAVGGSGTILTSVDGSTWVQRSSGTGVDLYGVAAGEGGFVAVGSSGMILRQNLAVPSTGGGGGGGGCNTAGPAGPVWPEVFWITLLAAGLWYWRWKVIRDKR